MCICMKNKVEIINFNLVNVWSRSLSLSLSLSFSFSVENHRKIIIRASSIALSFAHQLLLVTYRDSRRLKRILCARHCFWLPTKQTKTQCQREAAASSRLISNHFQTYFIPTSGSRLNIEWFDFMRWLISSDNICEECNARRKRANYRDKICRMPFFSLNN